MNLSQAIEYFIKNLPDNPTGHDDILNDCIFNIQTALGQQHGDAASIYFSEPKWFYNWVKAKSKEDKKEIIFNYVRFELNHLSI